MTEEEYKELLADLKTLFVSLFTNGLAETEGESVEEEDD